MTPTRNENPAAGTFVFADLAGFTALIARWGDDIAAEVAIALADAARRLAAEHGGRLVKTMGDSVMLRADDPAAAVRLGIGIAQAAPALRARVGIHAGPAVEVRRRLLRARREPRGAARRTGRAGRGARERADVAGGRACAAAARRPAPCRSAPGSSGTPPIPSRS